METKAGVNTVASEGRVPGQDVPAEHTYLDFLFFKLNPEYRRLSVGERSKGVEEFLAVDVRAWNWLRGVHGALV